MPNDDETRTRPSQALTLSAGRNEGTDCLVVIYTREPTLLGQRFALEHDPTQIGRGTANHIVLDGGSVSRHHAKLQKRESGWTVIDVGSTNGTYCNDEQVSREVALRNGDRVKIGPTIFKFLSGADVEVQYHEEIYRLTITDGLTQAYNKRYFYEVLQREIGRCRRQSRDLAVLLFDVDHFKRINEVHGTLAGDFVLKEVALMVQSRIRRDEVFARYGGDDFAIILPGASRELACERAEILRQKVAEHLFVFQGDSFRVTISVGAELLQESDRSDNDLVMRADHSLYVAKRSGRNRVVAGSSVAYRRLLEGPSLLQRALAREPPCSLLAFELNEERTIIERLGSSVYEDWFRQLVRDVELALGEADDLATWRDRYVLAALVSESAEVAAETAARVRATWTAHPSEEKHRAVTREIRSASLDPAEIASHRERSLDVLVSRLLPRPPDGPTPDDGLPFPIAALRAMVAGRRTTLGCVKSLLDGIETALRFTVAIWLGVVREGSDPALTQRSARVIAGSQKLQHSWETLALELAALVPQHPRSAISESARAFTQATANCAPLATELPWAARLRRSMLHQTGLSEDAHGADEGRLRNILDTLVAALYPIGKLRLVSVAQIEDVHDEESFQYGLYLHRGPGEHFPIVREHLPFRLQKGWCYLLAEDREHAPIGLAPVVVSRTCDTCGRVEVAVAERLTLARGAKVAVRGVTTNHQGTVEVPSLSRMQALHQAVLEVSTPGLEPELEVTKDGAVTTAGHLAPAPEQGSGTGVRPAAEAVKILFLGANPSDTTRLALDEEVREIDARLLASKHRDAFQLEQSWAVRATDLQACLLRHRPTIVHFSGHGSATNQMLLKDEIGEAKPMSPAVLGDLFHLLGPSIRCVVLNACYTETQAKAIAAYVDCVIGMASAVPDGAAIAFVGAFYQALGYGENVKKAFGFGCNQMALVDGRIGSARDLEPEERGTGAARATLPRLLVREGVRAEDVRFIHHGGGASSRAR